MPSLSSVALAINTSDLEVRYGDTLAVAGVDLEVPKGSLLSVIGPNGAGKSALLNALAGTVAPTRGSATVEGKTPALVLQATDVDRSLPITVREVVSLARYSERGFFGRMRATDREVVAKSLERLNIQHLASRQFHELSGGERQRALVAQGLAQEADVLLLDEPTSSLDSKSEEEVQVAFETLMKGRTSIVIAHRLSTIMNADRIIVMKDGGIDTIGTHDELITQNGHYAMLYKLQFKGAKCWTIKYLQLGIWVSINV